MAETRTLTLTEFLSARLDEDEAKARTAVDDDLHWLHLGSGLIIQGDSGFTVSSGWLVMPHRFEAGDHIARHDPGRVLAEVAAKRAIVDRHGEKIIPPYDVRGELRWCKCLHDAWPCPDLLHLASVYADHPDYRQEWKP